MKVVMKRVFGLLLVILIFSSCQDEGRSELMSQPETEKVPDSIQVLEGDFVFGTNSAVIRGKDFVYGVTIDSMSRALARKIAPFKKDDFDMIPVAVKAKILPNQAQEGWEEVIVIREIIEIPEQNEVSDTVVE